MDQIDDVYKWLKTAKKQLGDEKLVSLGFELVKEEVEELRVAIEEDDEQEILDAVVDIFWVCMNVTYGKGISPGRIKKMFDKVKESNFSKFCKSEEEAILTVNNYKLQNVICSYEKVGSLYVILREDGKILKNINYIAVK